MYLKAGVIFKLFKAEDSVTPLNAPFHSYFPLSRNFRHVTRPRSAQAKPHAIFVFPVVLKV